MDKLPCPFGALFREYRTTKHISMWQVVHRMGYYLANVQRMEAGIQHPGVRLAFRFLHSIDVDAGSFMQKLARENAAQLPHSLSTLETVALAYTLPSPAEGRKSLFGPFLQQARVASGISKTAMAKAAGYNLRNINGVESGRQDPGIMTALALVMATGVDVREFFSVLYVAWQGQEGEGASSLVGA